MCYGAFDVSHFQRMAARDAARQPSPRIIAKIDHPASVTAIRIMTSLGLITFYQRVAGRAATNIVPLRPRAPAGDPGSSHMPRRLALAA